MDTFDISPSLSEATITFKLDVNSIEANDDGTRSLSFPCKIRSLLWRIVISERTKKYPNSFGYFLNCFPNTAERFTWSCYASAELTLVSQKEGVKNKTARIHHIFSSETNTWGCPEFSKWHFIMDPQNGFIKDNLITFQAHIKAEAPQGVPRDSRKEFGFVGLRNSQLATFTSYMNSLLQILYFNNQLRKIVYKIPVDTVADGNNDALDLQTVFYDLQFHDKSVDTQGLTVESFGLESMDPFLFNIREFLLIFLERLNNKLKNTSYDGIIPKLFEGKMEQAYCSSLDESVIYQPLIKLQRPAASHKMETLETFSGIQLEVKGHKNIMESFEKLMKSGAKDADHPLSIKSFPPVLHLYLKRFQDDFVTGSSAKFSDRFEFYEKINLDAYLQLPDKTSASYTLQAVLVCSRDNLGGISRHYRAYINPRCDGKHWYEFDDEMITPCSKKDAIESNFGGQDDESDQTALMLVYIRDSELKNVLQEVTEEDIPTELEQKLQRKGREERVRQREIEESDLYIPINVFLEDVFFGHRGCDLVDFNSKKPSKVLRKKKTTPMKGVLLAISNSFDCFTNQLRIWPFKMRPNKTCRPTYFDMESDLNKSIFEVAGTDSWNIFLEIYYQSPNCELPPFNSKNQILVFFKCYDPVKGEISYCGHNYLNLGSPVSNLIKLLNQKVGYPQNTDLLVFEEVDSRCVKKITRNDLPLEMVVAQLCDGDIFIFQKNDTLTADSLTCEEYFRGLTKTIDVVFINKNLSNDSGITVQLPSNINFKAMIEAAIENSGIANKEKLQIEKCHLVYHEPRS